MSFHNTSPIPGSDSTPLSGFSSQTQMGLAEVLQMVCLSRRSGQIIFRSGESYGYVYIQHGRVLHALCGVVEGEEAIYLMLTWPDGGFTLDDDILPHKKTIKATWEQLLFEGARRADMGPTDSKNLPAPVTTFEPVSSTRARESQPKLLVTPEGEAPSVFELQEEYTHVGRAAGNEIPLPFASVSNRHCMFILSGPDIVLRDLNSSNGTLVNGESISETILRPGDIIQVGTVQMKFEPGIKRPKLSGPLPLKDGTMVEVPPSSSAPAMGRATLKLPQRATCEPAAKVTDDSAYVKGESAISYEDLPKPEVEKRRGPWLIILATIVILALLGGAYYYLVVRHGSR